ncbi:hypothetical protein B0G82_5785 [Paraburkholderia sp. BL17N1]|nr:hypothetical protein B0G82_5785 [Paraburkholderia sp. BL17N1]
MPVVDFELSLCRTQFESDHPVREQVNQDWDSDFAGLARGAK